MRDFDEMVTVTVNARETFKGILVTTDFTTATTTAKDNADFSDGTWILNNSNANMFRLAVDKESDSPGCGITHANNQLKTGSHTFLFQPNNDAWRSKGFRVLIVKDPKEIFHQFHVDADARFF